MEWTRSTGADVTKSYGIENPTRTTTMSSSTRRKLKAEHGIVCRLPKGERFSYFGWPTVARLDDGTLMVASSGLRAEHICPFGKTVLNISRDDGATWEHDWIIRDDGPDGDLGYPSTVELADGSLFTVCYQKAAAGEKCSLLWSRWELPSR
jgi:hypothetical protein